MKKLIGALIMAFGVMLAAAPMLAADIPATVVVAEHCDLTVDLDPLDFGSLAEGATSLVETRDFDLDVNTPTDVTIWGTDWDGDATATTMHVYQTEYGLDVAPSIIRQLALSPGANLVSSSVDMIDSDLNFRVVIPNPQAADTYSQTVTVTFACD